MLIVTILIICLLYLLLRPFIRIWLIGRKMRRGNFDFLNDIFGNPGAQGSSGRFSGGTSSARGKRGSADNPPKKKKIGKDVGEYVKFQEIKVEASETTEATDGSTVEYTREEQITDVEWEDIKEDEKR